MVGDDYRPMDVLPTGISAAVELGRQPGRGMKRAGCVLIMLMTMVSVGCARRDWVSDTLTVVDVTGTWERSAQCKVIGGLNDRIVRMVLWQRGTRVTGEINALGGRLGGASKGRLTARSSASAGRQARTKARLRLTGTT